MTLPLQVELNSFSTQLKQVYADIRLSHLTYKGYWDASRACTNRAHAGFGGAMSDCSDPECIVAHVIEE